MAKTKRDIGDVAGCKSPSGVKPSRTKIVNIGGLRVASSAATRVRNIMKGNVVKEKLKK